MVTPRQPKKPPLLDMGSLPMPQGADSSTKWLIAAVLAAGKDNCECPSCQLLKRFGTALSTALLQEAT